MAATAKDIRAAHVPDEVRRWSDTFNAGVTVDEDTDEEEPQVPDSDFDFERVAEEEQNAGVAASEIDAKMTAPAHARVQEQSSGAAAANRHGDEEEVSEDGNVQTPGGFIHGRKRKATVTHSKPQTTGTETHDKNGHGECLRAENEMLRQQLTRKAKELEAEQIRSLKLELHLKDKEIESLKKQNEDLRAENEHCRKTAKPQKTPRLCRSCKGYVLGHDYRNCPKKRASSSSSEQDEGNASS